MVTKEAFLELLERQSAVSSGELEEISAHWDCARDAAVEALNRMPSIGFLSVQHRLNAFLSVCRHLDQMVGDGRIDASEAQMALNILRLSSKRFSKAITMFDTRAPRFDAACRAEMPDSAKEYLAGLEYAGG